MIIWKITNLECYINHSDSENVVFAIGWSASKYSLNKTVFRSGKTEIEINGTNFIPFNNLTEALVLDWLFEKIELEKSEIENSITNELNELLNPKTISLIPPWN